MQKRHIAYLVFAIGLVAGCALMLSLRQQSATEKHTGLTLPGLTEEVNEVRLLAVGPEDKQVRVFRDTDNVWKVQQLENYPADLGKIRQFLYRLGQSRILEKKTDQEERLPKLKLDQAQAQPVTLMRINEEKAYQPMASLLVGKYDEISKGSYIRYPEDTQGWLVSEDLRAANDSLSWVDATVVHLPRSDVRRIEIVHMNSQANGQTGRQEIVLEREKRAEDFMLKNLPEGYRLKAPHLINQMSRALEQLRFRGVARVSKRKGETALLVTFHTFAGVEVYLDFVREEAENQYWGKVYAVHNPANASMKSLSEEATQEEKEAHETAFQERMKTGAKQVEKINQHTAGWLYQLTPHHFALLSKRMDDLTERPSGKLPGK